MVVLRISLKIWYWIFILAPTFLLWFLLTMIGAVYKPVLDWRVYAFLGDILLSAGWIEADEADIDVKRE